MAKRKRIKKSQIYLFLEFSIFSILMILVYAFMSNSNPYDKVKIDKKLDIIYSVYNKKDFSVPSININDEVFYNINQYIVTKAYEFISKEGSSISYNYTISGEVISLAIQYVELDKYERPIVDFDTYVINIMDKHLLTQEEILNKLNISIDEINGQLSHKFRAFYNDEKDKKILDQECDYECFLYMRGIENNNYIENIELYISEGKLYVLRAFDIYSPFSEEDYFTFDDFLFEIN